MQHKDHEPVLNAHKSMASGKEREEMEEIRKVARAYFDGQNDDDRLLAARIFRSLDENGDGKVSLEEYRKHVSSSSSGHPFELLDANGDGALELEEFLTLYYMDNVLIPRCGACHVALLTSSYFSCLPCLGKTSYHLCCRCYGGGGFQHCHVSTEFADTRALLKLMDGIMAKAEVIATAPEEVQKDASCCEEKPVHSSPSPARSTNEAQEGGSGNKANSVSTPTRSRTGTFVKKLGVCATKIIIIQGAGAVAVASGCCVM